MARRITSAPSLKRHKRSGNGYARFNGKQLWFGPYDLPETHAKFATFKARWETNGRTLPDLKAEAPPFTVADVAARYLEHAEIYYRREDGSQTHEVANIRYSLRPLLALYRTLPASNFNLRSLKEVREAMIASGLARPTVNIRIGRIVRIFGWGAEEEFVVPEVFGALRALRPLKRGRSKAHETQPVRAVSWADVEATLPYLMKPVRDMVLLLWFTGMRPGEARQLCHGAIDRSGTIWFYRPPLHKTQHHGKERTIAIGPKAQEVLSPYLLRVPSLDPAKPMFSPRNAMSERHQKAKRKGRTRRKRATLELGDPIAAVMPGDCYSKDSLARAITRASKTAGIGQWSPNQLRHAAATRIRKELGIDAARAVLGHSSAETTEVYAEIDLAKAQDAMAMLG